MSIATIPTIEEMKSFCEGTKHITYTIDSREEAYALMRSVLVKHRHIQLSKKEKGIVKTLLQTITGYSSIQMKRLIRKWKDDGLKFVPIVPKGRPPRKYTSQDIQKIIDIDVAHQRPNGKAVKEYLQRVVTVFGDESYINVAKISVSHIYNIRRNSNQYQSSKAMSYTKTKQSSVDIGIRMKPHPDGVPGFLRVDSVHQGDFQGEKGVYHINIIDEVTQYEVIGCVPQITWQYMKPLLYHLIQSFPFKIYGFHSDNGSEYINHEVADMLKKLAVQQTKSRSRKSNDQALVEGKNGSVIRKHMGRSFIAKESYELINDFYEQYFNPYVNYHRVSLYPTNVVDKNGKIRKKYNEATTPYEKLKSLDDSQRYLKDGVTFARLDTIAYRESDLEAAQCMQKAKSVLFNTIRNRQNRKEG